MIIERGVPKNDILHTKDDASEVKDLTSCCAGKGAEKRGAGLLDDEMCSNEDDDEDDILSDSSRPSGFPPLKFTRKTLWIMCRCQYD